MISEYHRPQTLEQALFLLDRKEPKTVPLGGGTYINQPSSEVLAVVDLQDLVSQPGSGLGQIQQVGSTWRLGAAVTLQLLLEKGSFPSELQEAIRHETSYNLRQVATIAGTLVSATGRSPLAASLLALDAQFEISSIERSGFHLDLGEFYARRNLLPANSLIMAVILPVSTKFVFKYVARTPADFPIVATAAAQWPSGRTRLALAGFGPSPILAADGPESLGLEIAARNAFYNAGDEWASAEYRRAMAETLTLRCLAQLAGEK